MLVSVTPGLMHRHRHIISLSGPFGLIGVPMNPHTRLNAEIIQTARSEPAMEAIDPIHIDRRVVNGVGVQTVSSGALR